MSLHGVQFKSKRVRGGLQVAVLGLNEEGLGLRGLADLQVPRAQVQTRGVGIDVGQEEHQGPRPRLRWVAWGFQKGCLSMKEPAVPTVPGEGERGLRGKELPRRATEAVPSLTEAGWKQTYCFPNQHLLISYSKHDAQLRTPRNWGVNSQMP